MEKDVLHEGFPGPSPSWSKIQAHDDCALMRLLLAGNDDAMAVIVDRYQRLVLSVATRIVRNASDAEDVVQTVFFDIFRDRGRFDPSRGTLKVWILQYAYTRSINRRHHLEQRQFYSVAEVENVPATIPPSYSFDGHRLSPAETTRLIRELLDTLNAPQRAAIQLICFEGLTLPEAAQRTGETLPVLRHNYYRGLMKLRETVLASAPSQSSKKDILAEAHDGFTPLEVKNFKPRTI